MHRLFIAVSIVYATSLPGCAGSNPQEDVLAELTRYEGVLEVAVTAPPTVRANTTAELTITVLNRDDREIRACWYRDAFVYFWGLEPKYIGTIQQGMIVDHHYCEEPLNLAPGASVTLAQPIHIPDLPSGTARVSVRFWVVHPRSCDRYGCDATVVKGSTVNLVTVEGAPNQAVHLTRARAAATQS